MAAEAFSAIGTPVYTTKAYVFYVSPDNRERWNQTSSKAIDVSIVITPSRQSPGKRDLKLVAVNDETGVTILNDVITKTPFDQRSLKFCQWIDSKRLLWGLGFDQEGPLEEFIRRVDLLKQELAHPSPQATLPPAQPPKPRQQTGSTSSHQTSPSHQQHVQPQPQQQTQYENHDNSNWDKTHQPQQQQQLQQTNGQPNVRGRLTSSGSLTQQQLPSTSLPPRGENQQQLSNGNNPVKSNGGVSNNNISGQHSRSHSTIGNQNKNIAPSPENVENPTSGDISQQFTNIEQLKYENDRLKQALEEISNNAGLWHQELITLRKNNAKLTQALQESKSNVQEWQIELANLREENRDLKLRLRETNSNPEQKNDLLEYIEKLQKEMSAKDQDIEKLRVSMDELALSKQKSEDQMNNNSSAKLDQNQKQALLSLQNRMDSKVSELKAISQELTMVVDKISQ